LPGTVRLIDQQNGPRRCRAGQEVCRREREASIADSPKSVPIRNGNNHGRPLALTKCRDLIFSAV
jgi:hypothetical protein